MAAIQATAVSHAPTRSTTGIYDTKILPISISDLGSFNYTVGSSFVHRWSLDLANTASGTNLKHAVDVLKKGESPVAFPTETVYGLAADATSSQAVLGIYKAKNRPADNPLIVHFCHLHQLRSFLEPAHCDQTAEADVTDSVEAQADGDPIPKIYHELISKFWPGPLTILLPLPQPSPLAPEVTHSLQTFGARIPDSVLALALIQQAGNPLAAPSANASTRPSPTTAQHVLEDMNGRIEVILDGGACNVGVESTVVDGLSSPPCILRPGGVSIDDIRTCPGWENVVNGYTQTERSHVNKPNEHLSTNGNDQNKSNPSNEEAKPNGELGPRAPGMKYRHYAPRAKVVLVERRPWSTLSSLVERAKSEGYDRVGIISTRKRSLLDQARLVDINENANGHSHDKGLLFEAFIGPDVLDVSRGLFGALRALDGYGVDVIFAEGREQDEGKTAEAVMNRLRKAAEEIITE